MSRNKFVRVGVYAHTQSTGSPDPPFSTTTWITPQPIGDLVDPIDMAKQRSNCRLALCGLAVWTVVCVLHLVSIRPVVAQPPRWVAPTGSTSSPPIAKDFSPPIERWLSGHRGVDLFARPGDAVRSAGNGTVSYVGTIAGRSIVTVTHGALRTTYEPVTAVVSVGEHVAVGNLIGTVGLGGHCNETCLHWGLLRGDEYLNPLLLLSWRPPVLKSPNRSASQRISSARASRSRPIPPNLRADTAEAHQPTATVSPTPTVESTSTPTRLIGRSDTSTMKESINSPATVADDGLLALGSAAAAITIVAGGVATRRRR